MNPSNNKGKKVIKINAILASKANGTKRREQIEKKEPYIEYKAVPRKTAKKIS